MQFRLNEYIIILSLYTIDSEGTILNDFMTTEEAAELWNISVRQVQNHCKNGRIKGLLKVGTNYLIPKDAVKPTYTYIYESNENTKK